MEQDHEIEERRRQLERHYQRLRTAEGFPNLCEDKRLIFGEGNPAADLVLIGEAPGGQEERLGQPFVGPAGQILNEALEAVGLVREELWITNVVKCRPTMEGIGGRLRNRTPTPAEIAWFVPWLQRELEIVQPQAIVCLGATAGTALLGRTLRITRERGTWFDGPNGIPLLVTYHPAYLLRRTQDRDLRYAEFVEDIQTAAARAGVVAEAEGEIR